MIKRRKLKRDILDATNVKKIKREIFKLENEK
jgi:hypothetical protein